jgi:hypothetical protein
MSLFAATAWLTESGYKAGVDPDVGERVATWSYNGPTSGIRRSIERVYGVSSSYIDGVVWFGGRGRFVQVVIPLGGSDVGELRGAVEGLLGGEGHVFASGGRLIVMAPPVVAEMLKGITWYSERDYRIKLDIIEIRQRRELGLRGSGADVSISKVGVGLVWSYALLADGEVARLARSVSLVTAGGSQAHMSIGEERGVTRYAVEADSLFASGTEVHEAGLGLTFRLGDVDDQTVAIVYDVESSAFSEEGQGNVGRQISKVSGVMRSTLGKRYKMAEYEGAEAQRWLGLRGVGATGTKRRVVLVISVESGQGRGGQKSAQPPSPPVPAKSGGGDGRRSRTPPDAE